MKTNKEVIVDKKNEILNGLFKTKDGLTWNETSELINELVELTQRWIPVEEELPEVGELVQVQIQEFLGGSIHFDHDKVIEVENGHRMFNCEQCAVRVIAWRPIELK